MNKKTKNKKQKKQAEQKIQPYTGQVIWGNGAKMYWN